MSKIQLILQTETTPVLDLYINSQIVKSTIYRDDYNNIQIVADTVLDEHNNIALDVHSDGLVNLIEIIIDDIRFGLVTFLCTTVDGIQNTQITAPGKIDIKLATPVWKFWCDKLTEFNYERYPLGSAT